MSKLLIAVIGSVFLLGSAGVMASGNKESRMPPMAAQDILNKMACEGKKDGEKTKDRVDGEMVTCPPKIKQPNFGK
ncbi:MAG: hypothetical protein LZF61_00515 [Nitrosomonas sp.]|nr:MAG: hypothetical protein LZF61_00515 [Nitrosomonas sp.]